MNRKERRRAKAVESETLRQPFKRAYADEAAKFGDLTEDDPADIIVIVRDGVVDRVVAPAGLSVQLRDYDPASAWAEGSVMHRDAKGDVYGASWIKEPGTANAE